ncbi:hypothetical protein KSC_101310 [Ktedonobacter sp. SOSP1-52]|uniref:hypothetical protein n=1 Tax=Ktedonobacter sp. SOSP1-52 TaxID=2778366 RepID=UPI001916910E|nr:hypothetical protein [Ktedonobacter sp. SOSP1-52]GHO71239.1 hypothetical protein KSC_101310 [Ktedonobacter sp. SOSP1-52]
MAKRFRSTLFFRVGYIINTFLFLKKSLIGARSFVLAYFNVTADASLTAFEREALNHPVFLVKSHSEHLQANKSRLE